MTDLDRLDALAAAATPGPWVQSMFVDGREYEHMSKPWKDARQAEEVRMVRSGSAKGQHVALAQDPWNAEADAAFIAACDPATIRDLVAAARERDELRTDAEKWRAAEAEGHIVDFTETGFGLHHPPSCRPDLIGCWFNVYLSSRGYPDEEPGRYRMTRHKGHAEYAALHREDGA